MAKSKISITVDTDLLDQTDSKIKDGVFRNRSHAFEFALRKHIDERNDLPLSGRPESPSAEN